MRNVSSQQIVAIVMTTLALVGVLLLKRQCGSAVSNLFRAMEVSVDGGHDGSLTSPDTTRN
jgi:hypothetical protein